MPLDEAMAQHTSPEFEKWWEAPSENHKGRGGVYGSIETNVDFVMSDHE